MPSRPHATSSSRVITRPDARRGGAGASRRRPVKVRAEELGLPVLTPRSVKDRELLDELGRLEPDACPVVAYGSLIPRVALDLPTARLDQPALLAAPRVARAAPVQHAIMAGDEITGATTFRLERGSTPARSTA